MRAVFRADASRTIGHGHVRRCLTLAGALRERGASVGFVCREHPDHLADFIESQGFDVSRLPAASAPLEPAGGDPAHAAWLGVPLHEDAAQTHGAIAASGPRPDWLVIDHYAIDHRWERALRATARHLMVIDDLADRQHDCDVLLDQNYFADPVARYEGLVPSYCQRFFGPEYVLLREEFRAASPTRTTGEPRLLLTFGGDPAGQTEKAMDAVAACDRSMAMDVVVSGGNHRADAIASKCRELPGARFISQSDRMAELMAGASLCLGAGGITTFERLYMGLPSIVVATADNQREPLAALGKLGCLEYLGDAAQVGTEDWVAALRRWDGGPKAQAPLAVGTRTGQLPEVMALELVPFAERHIEPTYQFLQDAQLVADFATVAPPSWERHLAYWQDKLAAGIESVFAIEREGRHVGNCGIKPMPDSPEHEGWIYLAPSAGRRSGAGETAFRRLLRTAFEELKLPRLYLHVRRDNAAALGLYHKIGFRPATGAVDAAAWGALAPAMCKLMIAR